MSCAPRREWPAVVNLSLPRNGTRSIAEWFRDQGAVHEGHHLTALEQILRFRAGTCSEAQLRAFFHQRQKNLDIGIDSASFMHFVADHLGDWWPKTRFIHVIREPKSWIRSYLLLLYQSGKELMAARQRGLSPWKWMSLRALSRRYGQLQSNGLDPVLLYEAHADGEYLQHQIGGLARHWLRTTRHILDAVPEERVFRVRLEHLGAAHGDLCDWMRVPIDEIETDQVFNRSAHTGVEAEVERGITMCTLPSLHDSCSYYQDILGGFR